MQPDNRSNSDPCTILAAWLGRAEGLPEAPTESIFRPTRVWFGFRVEPQKLESWNLAMMYTIDGETGLAIMNTFIFSFAGHAQGVV